MNWLALVNIDDVETIQLLEDVSQRSPNDPRAAALLLYTGFSLYLAPPSYRPRIDRRELRARLVSSFKKASLRYRRTPSFLFFVGMFAGVAEKLFASGGVEADAMRSLAFSLEPTNQLYEWGACRDRETRTRRAQRARLAAGILENRTICRWLREWGPLGEHIGAALHADAMMTQESPSG